VDFLVERGLRYQKINRRFAAFKQKHLFEDSGLYSALKLLLGSTLVDVVKFGPFSDINVSLVSEFVPDLIDAPTTQQRSK
jgi:hypothetical protein